MIRCGNCGGRSDRPALFNADDCVPTHPAPTLAQRIVAAIESDLSDRRGIRQEWEQIDPDVQDEIRDEWAKIIEKLLP